MEGCGLSLVVLPFLRLLGVMGRKQHHCELAAFLAFGIETVAQVAYLPLFILDAKCRGFQLHTECGGFPLEV